MKSLACLALACFAFAAHAAGADVAIVNDLAGKVLYGTAQATAFMKVREGDAFTVEKGARVRLLYLSSGRQEAFAGPARFVAGADASRVREGAQPQVQVLPRVVPMRIAKTLDLAGSTKLSRVGGITVRGGPKLTAGQQAELAQARKTYAELRSATAENDITPELYLYSVLHDLQLSAEMKSVAAEMRRRQPDSPEVARMTGPAQ